jgi:hypothetical protein
MPEAIAVALLVIGVPILTLILVLKLDGADEPPPGVAVPGRSGWPWLDRLLWGLRPWHAVASIVLTCLIFAAVFARPAGFPLVLAGLLLLVLFVRAWRHEFVALMSCPDDAFPGRNDKLVWTLLMVLIAPVGFSCFRAFRKAHRIPSAARAKPAPIHDLL